MGKPTPPLPAREELDVDEDFWNDVLPNDAAWTCVECDEVCQGDVCQQCGECRVRARSAFCPGGHAMVISATQEGGYKSGWVCTLCDESGKGERWFCALCQADYCYTCSPRPALPSATCTVGHAMKSVPPAKGKGVCLGPGCNVSWPGPTARWRCDSCDYDLCGHCYKREVCAGFSLPILCGTLYPHSPDAGSNTAAQEVFPQSHRSAVCVVKETALSLLNPSGCFVD